MRRSVIIDHLCQSKRKLDYISLIKNFGIVLGTMILATLLSFLFRYIGFHESNIIMAYILGVLVVSTQTDGYVYGIIASAIGVLTFNFFFTEPYYTFAAYSPEYPVTFIIMLIVAIIAATLTTRYKNETYKTSLREIRAQTLYQISKSLLKVRSVFQIAEIAGRDIVKLFNRSVVIAVIGENDGLDEPRIYSFRDDERTDIFKSFNELQAITETFKTGIPGGAGTPVFSDSSAYYLPIKGQSGMLGVIGIDCFNNNLLNDEQKELLETVATQIAFAIERERLSEKQQKSKIDVERERLRSNLLRSISHDLRTPLTDILGATGTILENDEKLDRPTRRELLLNVYEDASWLIHSVENILSMTRIDEGRIEIKKSMEAVEEIVAGVVSRFKKLAENHVININMPDELIMLPMNGALIEQVLANLIDNAVRYTPTNSTIDINIRVEGEHVVFEVSDNGGGFPEDAITSLFNRFFTVQTHEGGRRGTGLGLAICKSIITAHGGDIEAYNNDSGGATFKFVLPLKE